jgi:hypothetical protein
MKSGDGYKKSQIFFSIMERFFSRNPCFSFQSGEKVFVFSKIYFFATVPKIPRCRLLKWGYGRSMLIKTSPSYFLL